MPRIALTAEVTALINHYATHHGYAQGNITAVTIHRDVSRSYNMSLCTVRRCLTEFRQFGRAEPKWNAKGVAHYRRCRTPETIRQVRALVISPNAHAHAHKSPPEVTRLLRSRGRTRINAAVY
jgi:hypothetical protein